MGSLPTMICAMAALVAADDGKYEQPVGPVSDVRVLLTNAVAKADKSTLTDSDRAELLRWRYFRGVEEAATAFAGGRHVGCCNARLGPDVVGRTTRAS